MRYRYRGSLVTSIRQGEEDITLFPEREYELEAKEPRVKSMIAQGLLEPLSARAQAGEPGKEKKEKPENRAKEGKGK